MRFASVLFAAGGGERLRPLTAAVPKPALPLLDVPLGAFGLTALSRDAPPVVVNLSHLAGAVRAALAPFAPADRVGFLDEGAEPYGTGATLVALGERLGERVLTWSADVLTGLAPATLLEAHRASGAPATVAVRRVDRGADLALDGTTVRGFIDRRREPERSGAQFLNPAVFESEALHLLPSGRPLGLAEGLLRPLAERGALRALVFDGYWIDAGTPARYLRAALDLLDGALEPPGGAWPGTIIETAGGHAYLGPGARAEAGSLGPGAVLLRGCEVEAGARLRRCVVGPGERVPGGAALGDAIFWGGRALDVSPAERPPRTEPSSKRPQGP
ncbi:MAG: sugar phosphate nucleotidyltransferase [Actinomycetota bacterium]